LLTILLWLYTKPAVFYWKTPETYSNNKHL